MENLTNPCASNRRQDHHVMLEASGTVAREVATESSVFVLCQPFEGSPWTSAKLEKLYFSAYTVFVALD